jgi:hypothetical protein
MSLPTRVSPPDGLRRQRLQLPAVSARATAF